ncbi:hypothetical protein BOTBODRAFT_159039 [Botryobasidium botryosum FD-172 SS1]|uniref:Protein kinase domain-containing protein n=1 Tax=Botryobasidium botryosum (strain FD-172 SS1) TaxID=930990 RepID=A0A067MFL1_BOTB1|nr:hypothetical protein BOTBODRAFT_159039 [Botryobasidium botryosum FD-172 SS1]
MFDHPIRVTLRQSGKRKTITVSDLSKDVKEPTEDDLIGTGGFGSVYSSEMERRGRVALKRLYTPVDHGRSIERRFLREMGVWSLLDHPHILEFIGICKFGKHTYMVSPWVDNGNIRSHLREYDDADRLRVLYQTAEALKYLHEHNPQIIHGDLKAENILQKNNKDVLLCDFGLAAVAGLRPSTESNMAGSPMYMAPELLNPSNDADGARTARSDVFAFGILVAVLLAGEYPFNLPNRLIGALVYAIMTGRRPSRPADANEHIWFLAEQCWQENSLLRPTMHAIHLCLSAFCKLDPVSMQHVYEMPSTGFDQAPYTTILHRHIPLSNGIIPNEAAVEVATPGRTYSLVSPPVTIEVTGLLLARPPVYPYQPFFQCADPNSPLPGDPSTQRQHKAIENLLPIVNVLKDMHESDPPKVHGSVRWKHFSGPVPPHEGDSTNALIGLPWTAPELLNIDENVAKTTASDIFAFGMAISEVFTYLPPFRDGRFRPRSSGAILKAILDGVRPLRHSDMNDGMWELAQACWSHDPSARPSIREVEEMLGRLI